MVQEGKIICHLYAKNVEMHDLAFAHSIRELQPYGINWSNIPEYMDRKEFINFARACSTPDTVHIVHFCHWWERVYGSVHVDYAKDRGCLEDIVKEFKSVKQSKAVGRLKLGESGGNQSQSFFRDEIISHPFDEVGMALISKFRNKLEDYFLSDIRGQPLNRSTESVSVCELFSQWNIFYTAFTFSNDLPKSQINGRFANP
jgi:hypothetical protein